MNSGGAGARIIEICGGEEKVSSTSTFVEEEQSGAGDGTRRAKERRRRTHRLITRVKSAANTENHENDVDGLLLARPRTGFVVQHRRDCVGG